MVTFQDIINAQEVITGHVHKTPLISSTKLEELLDVNLYLKAEIFQKMGSFKMRGVLNKLQTLTEKEKNCGVITVSAGNHAQSLAYVCKNRGIQAVIIMPSYAATNKVATTKKLGAEVILHKDSHTLLEKLNKTQAERNLTLVHPFDDPLIIAGQGTLGLEILNDFSTIPDVVIVPVGGGGLISGVAAAIKLQHPKVRIIGVEPTGAAAMYESLRTNSVVSLKEINTIADGLAAPFAGKHTLAHVKEFVDDIVLVSDEEIIQGIRVLLLQGKLVTEPAGAAGFAALLAKKIPISQDMNIVCVLSGGNIDEGLLKRIISEE
ncbi:pyridoxal-5'-phosphate-dependent protein beta subunit [Candidatus Heimdallarchaeota archaeon B3_Heim]|nr:MAG: pyridoxal-5'-phosphate-dependent protein beta subunit [Candidatus Heimdallarchaeota archaeon B3_Heim]